MTKYTLYLGTTYNPDNQRSLIQDVEKELYDPEGMFSVLEGYTFHSAAGFYKGKFEKCFVLTYTGNNRSAIDKICEQYKKKFAQESVLVDVQLLEAFFV
jgi:hypothetical protein